MDVVRPVIKMKMRKYGGGAEGVDIRFNLLALVDDHYEAASDELELLKREKRALERRLDEVDPEGWKGQVCGLYGHVLEAMLMFVTGRCFAIGRSYRIFRNFGSDRSTRVSIRTRHCRS